MLHPKVSLALNSQAQAGAHARHTVARPPRDRVGPGWPPTGMDAFQCLPATSTKLITHDIPGHPHQEVPCWEPELPQ